MWIKNKDNFPKSWELIKEMSGGKKIRMIRLFFSPFFLCAWVWLRIREFIENRIY